MQNYYFAPGPVPMTATVRVEHSHRSEKFHQTFISLTKKLSMALGMEVALIQGSASAAIESALMAVRAHTNKTLVLVNGTFSKRVFDYLYGEEGFFGRPEISEVQRAIEVVKAGKVGSVYAVQYETGSSLWTDLNPLGEACRAAGIPFIVDCVSGYPYFKPPIADILILSSSKLLRGLPAMGIVAYRAQWATAFFRDKSYLSLVRAIEYGSRGETPHTSLMPQIESLETSLMNQWWKPGVDAVDSNMEVLIDGLDHLVMGRKHSPVATFKIANPEPIVNWMASKGFHVYFNKNYMQDKFQVSLYNYAHRDVYEELNELIHGARDRKMVK